MRYSLPLLDCETGLAPAQNGYAEYSVTDESITVDFRLEEDCPNPKHHGYNEPLHEGDIVEILLTLGDKKKYLEIEVNLNGALYAAVITNRDGEGDILIDFLPSHEVTYSTSIADGIWSTRIELPISWLKTLGFRNNECWNLLREDYDDDGNMRLSCISPTYARSFHKIKAFLPINKGE